MDRCENIYCIDNFQATNGNFCICDGGQVNNCIALKKYKELKIKLNNIKNNLFDLRCGGDHVYQLEYIEDKLTDILTPSEKIKEY